MSSLVPSVPERPFPLGARELVVILALSQALQALAIDAMLPALGDIATDLAVSDANRRQLIVGLFLFGVGCGSLIPGPLADRFGRKPVLLGSVIAYIITSFGCALARDFTMMAVLRFLEGMLTSGLAVVASAIIRDRFEGDRMASLQSMIAVIFLAVPMFAPSIGQLVLLFAGWRWIFGLMGAMGAAVAIWIALRLPESLHEDFRQPIRFRTIMGNIGAILRTRASVGYVVANAFIVGVMWGYIQSCQQLLAEHFGAGKAFPLIFGGMALGMALANFTNSQIVERFGARRVGQTALLCYTAIAIAQFALAHSGTETLWQFVPLMTLNLICGSFMGANFTSIALQPFARIAGAASSLQIFIRTLGGSILGALVGQAYDNSARPLSTAMVVASLVAVSLVLWSEQGKLFRRLYPPGTPRFQ